MVGTWQQSGNFPLCCCDVGVIHTCQKLRTNNFSGTDPLRANNKIRINGAMTMMRRAWGTKDRKIPAIPGETAVRGRKGRALDQTSVGTAQITGQSTRSLSQDEQKTTLPGLAT
jgi:hypothetical protein